MRTGTEAFQNPPLGGRNIMRRRAVAGAAALFATATQALARDAEGPAIPLVWPPAAGPRNDSPSFSGHTDTVPDVVGRIGAPSGLTIFSEGNHLMALLSDDILGAFPGWAKAQPRFADLDLGNIVVVTLPQPLVVEMIRTGGVRFGNLTLDVSRASGFYPDAVLGGPAPLRKLHALGVLDPVARFFSKNRGRALLVRKGNPLGIAGLDDIARTGARLAQADAVEADARAGNRASAEALLGKAAADALFAQEISRFPGRLGIMHRDLPEMIARDYADVGLTHYHLVSWWARIFPDIFELVPIQGAERFPARIAFGRTASPLRPRALEAFEEFYFQRANEVYPRFDFARMTGGEYGADLVLS